MCRDADLCTSCLVAKSRTHTCVIQKCPRCFNPHNILLCPLAAPEKDVEGEEESAATYSSTQITENLFVLVREGAIGSRTLPVREASRDVELGKETPNEDVGCEPPPENPALERGESGLMRPPNTCETTPDWRTQTPVHPVKGQHAGEELGPS